MSFWRNYYHLVWATKERESLIQADIEEAMHGYLIKKAAELDVYIYAVNSWYDHIHLIAAIPPKRSVSEVIKHLKGSSSYHINHVLRTTGGFAWQRGFGCMTLGEKQRPAAEAYVEGQKRHHQEQTANAWLERYVEFDEGPPDTGLEKEQTMFREPPVRYDILGEPPF